MIKISGFEDLCLVFVQSYMERFRENIIHNLLRQMYFFYFQINKEGSDISVKDIFSKLQIVSYLNIVDSNLL